MAKRLFSLFIISIAAVPWAVAQRPTHVVWTAEALKTDGNNGVLVVRAEIDPGWHIFGTDYDALAEDAVAPQFTEFSFSASQGVEFTGELTPSVEPEVKFDESLKLMLPMWEGSVTFTREFAVSRGVTDATIEGSVEYMACTQRSCIPPAKADFSITFNSTPKADSAVAPDDRHDKSAAPAVGSVDADSATTDSGHGPREDNPASLPLLMSLLAGFIGGLLAQAVVWLFRRRK